MMDRPGLPTTSPMMRMFIPDHASPGTGERQMDDDIIGRRTPLDSTQTLLALAAATTWDGGDGVVSVLRSALVAIAPYDAGELALAMPTGFRRWTFTDDVEPIVGDDLLLDLPRRDAPFRIDHPEDAAPFP